MAIIQHPVPPRQPSQDEDFLQVGWLLMQIWGIPHAAAWQGHWLAIWLVCRSTACAKADLDLRLCQMQICMPHTPRLLALCCM